MLENHLKDGVALVKFFYWLERNLDKKISEFEASKKLEIFRRVKIFFSSFPDNISYWIECFNYSLLSQT